MARTTLHWTGPAASAGQDARQAMPAKRGVESPAHFQTSDRPRRWRLAVEQALKDPLEFLCCLRCGSQSHHGCLDGVPSPFSTARSLAGRTVLNQNREIEAVRAVDELRRDPQARRFEFPPEGSEAAESRHPSCRCAPLGGAGPSE